MSSRTSAVAAAGISEQTENSDSEATSSEWTDEKHSSYLKSMEASFVQQLYNSIEASGFHSQKQRSHARSCNQSESNPAAQRIKVGRSDPRTQQMEDRQFLLRNPWIQHIRAKSRENETVQDNASIEGQPMGARGRMMYTCGFVNITEHSSNAQAYQDSSISREFSGQNFDDEDNGGGSGQAV